MANRNNIIQKVLSLMSDKMDGDSVHLLDSYMNTALRNACEFIALNKPPNHEKLLLSQQQMWGDIIESYDAIEDFDYFDLNNFGRDFVRTNRFHFAAYETTDNKRYRLHHVNSIRALYATVPHDQIYYYVEGNKLYINQKATYHDIPFRIIVEHYFYAPINEYPDELDQYLIAELIKVASNEYNKQQVEKNEK